MAGKKNFELDIEIMGKLDPSLLAAISKTEQALKTMGASARTQGAVMSRVYAEAFDGLSRNVKNAGNEFSYLTSKAEHFHNVLRDIGAVSIGSFIGNQLSNAFEAGVEGVKETLSKAVEFSKEAFMKAADYQRTGEQLQIEMGGTKEEAQDALNKLQYWSDTSPFKVAGAAEAYRMLLSSGLTPDMAMKREKQLGDVAAATTPSGEDATQHLKAINEGYNKAVKGGALLERNLYMLEDAGVKIRPFLEKQMGLDPGTLGDLQSDKSLTALRKAVKAGKLQASDLDKFLDEVTGEGGKYYKGAEKMSHDAFGALSTFQDKWDNLVRSIGGLELNPVTDLLNRFNDAFTYDKFLAMQDWFNHAKLNVDAIYNGVLKGIEESTLGTTAIGIGQKIAKSFNISSIFSDLYTEVMDPSGVMHSVESEKMKGIEANVKKAMDQAAKIIDAVADFMLSKNVKNMASWTMNEGVLQPLKALFENLSFIIKLMADLSAWDLPALKKDFADHKAVMDKDAADHKAAREKAERLKNWAPPDISPQALKKPVGPEDFGPKHQGPALKPWFAKTPPLPSIPAPIAPARPSIPAPLPSVWSPITFPTAAFETGQKISETISKTISGASPSQLGPSLDGAVNKAQQLKSIIESIRPPSMSPGLGTPGGGPPAPHSEAPSGPKIGQVIYNIHGGDPDTIKPALADHTKVLADMLV